MATSSGRWVNYHRADVFLAVDILSEQHGFTFHPELSLHHPMLKRTRQPLRHLFHRILHSKAHYRDRGANHTLPGDEEYIRKDSDLDIDILVETDATFMDDSLLQVVAECVETGAAHAGARRRGLHSGWS